MGKDTVAYSRSHVGERTFTAACGYLVLAWLVFATDLVRMELWGALEAKQ